MKVFIETMGCPKNFNDSEVAAGIITASGHEMTRIPSEADVIIVNTCGFIEDAKRESIERIFDMSAFGKKLIVSGCLSERYAQELQKSLTEADVIIGVNDYDRLPEILSEISKDRPFKSEKSKDHTKNGTLMAIPNRKLPENAYSATLKIAEGCNNRCTYCVIPQIRGPYKSVPEDMLLSEAKWLAAQGIKELILIAQDTTAYGYDIKTQEGPVGTYKLAPLLRKLCRIDGIEWIRIMYAYEDRITNELIKTMAEEEKICNYIDIPLQHASDKILRAMDRRSSHESIKGTIRRLRAAMDDIHIRTTLITGFPGETEEDFEELLDMVETEEFERLGVFAYSKEEGTLAAEMPDQIPEEIKKERLEQIMMRQMDISLEHNRDMIGHVLEAMIDEEDEDGAYVARTRYDAPEIDNNVIVNTTQTHDPGDIINVRIIDAFDYDIVGEEV